MNLVIEENKLPDEECELLENFLLKKSEKEIIDSLDDIRTDISNKGKYTKIKKNILITKAKQLKKLVGKIWTKCVSMKFGEILKLLKLIEKLKKIFDSFEESPKQCFNVKCFGDFSNKKLSNFLDENKIMKIAGGGDHIIIFTEDGSIYSYGKNSFGQLGIGNNKTQDYPVKLLFVIENGEKKLISKVNFNDMISCGYSYTFLTINGKTYSFGAGENGRLGDNNCNHTNIPILINCVKMKKIVSGSTFTIGLSKDNELYSCGDKRYNGHGLEEDLLEFRKIDFKGQLFNDVSIGTGGYHTLALTLSGDIYTWGHNRVGQLGFESDKDKIEKDDTQKYETEEDVTEEDEDDHYYHKLPKRITNLPPIIQVRAGWGHSTLLSINKKILGCGRIDEDQFNFEDFSINNKGKKYVSKFTLFNEFNKNIKYIECGGTHSAAITNCDELYLWGNNDEKQLCEFNKNIKTSNIPLLFDSKLISKDDITIKNVILISASTFILYYRNI